MDDVVDFFERTVERALGRSLRGAPLLLSVSGGADSTALLLSAASLRERLSLALSCLHLDHGLRTREEARADEAHVRGLCDRLGLPCIVRRAEPGAIADAAASSGRGIEAEARLFRRSCWKEALAETGACRVLVGHTRDDLLETALMRFLRGSGPAGLAAMPENRGIVFRPLLSLGRADVLAYLGSLGESFRDDPSNADPAYLRNRVRHRLVPLLDAEFPGWRPSVSEGARTQGRVAEFLAGEASSRLSWTLDGGGRLSCDGAAFEAAPAILREEALFAGIDAFAAGGGEVACLGPDPVRTKARPEPRRATVELFAAGGVKAAEAGPVELRREAGRVVVSASRRFPADAGFCLVVEGPGSYALRGRRCLAALDPFAGSVSIRLPFVVRSEAPSGAWIVEDRFGVAARFDPASGVLSPAAPGEPPGYARPIFFSIL